MLCTSSYVCAKVDPWRPQCGYILVPVSDSVLRVASAPAVQLNETDVNEQMLNLVSSILASVHHSGASLCMLVLTVVNHHLVVLLGTNLPRGHGSLSTMHPSPVRDSVQGTHAIFHLSTLFHAGVEDCFLQAVQHTVMMAEALKPVVVCAFCPDVYSSSTALQPVFPIGPGIMIDAGLFDNLCGRHVQVSPLFTEYMPVVAANGPVLKFQNVSLSPLFAHVYIQVVGHLYSSFEAEMSVTSRLCKLQSIVAASRRVEQPETRARPVPTPTLPFDDGSTMFYSCFDSPSLYPALHALLQSFVQCGSGQEWLASSRNRGAPLTCGFVMSKARCIQFSTSTEVATFFADMQASLATPMSALSEMEGVVFDLLLQHCTLATMPPYFHPTSFCEESHGNGFLTILYLTQWRQTLKRLIEVAHEQRHVMKGCDAVLDELQQFRVGILVQGAGCPVIKSLHRALPQVSGATHHVFFINLQEHDVFHQSARSSLQQQRAEDRNAVVASFFGEALRLLGGVLGHDHVATLSEGYFGALKPKSLNNLAKVYERVQSYTRRIRQEVSQLRQREGRGRR